MRTRTKALIGGLLAGIPSGAFVGATFSDDTTTSVVAGIVFGLGATLGVGGYVALRERRWARWVATTLAELSDEGVVHYGFAKFTSTGAAIAKVMLGGVLADSGGLLVLTKQRLLFVPHRHNFLGKRGEVPVSDIAGAKRGAGLGSNSITIVTRDKEWIELVVRERDAWLAKLPGVRG